MQKIFKIRTLTLCSPVCYNMVENKIPSRFSRGSWINFFTHNR